MPIRHQGKYCSSPNDAPSGKWAVNDSNLRPWDQELARTISAGLGGSGFKRLFSPFRGSESRLVSAGLLPPLTPV
jgi:hypothetical protein